jgi:hypothetical protein
MKIQENFRCNMGVIYLLYVIRLLSAVLFDVFYGSRSGLVERACIENHPLAYLWGVGLGLL